MLQSRQATNASKARDAGTSLSNVANSTVEASMAKAAPPCSKAYQTNPKNMNSVLTPNRHVDIKTVLHPECLVANKIHRNKWHPSHAHTYKLRCAIAFQS